MDLKEYVQYYRTHGYTDEQLKQHLLSQGYQEAEVSQALKQQHVPWMLISLIVGIVFIFALSLFFFMSQPKQVPEPLPVEVPQISEPEVPDIIDPCEDKDCAQEALNACEPRKGSYSMFLVAEVEYEILGPKAGYCEVYVNLINAPQAELEGKDMACLMDSSLPIEDALNDLSRCEGALAEAFARLE